MKARTMEMKVDNGEEEIWKAESTRYVKWIEYVKDGDDR